MEGQLAAGTNGIGRLLRNRHLILIFRLVLGVTFLVSSFGKFVDIRHYSVAMVYELDILPGPLAIGFGWALPFIELLCGVGLLVGLLTRLSALGVGLLSISFFITKLILLARGTDIACGCFGAVGSAMASWSIYLDPAMLLLSAAILFSPDSSRHWVSLAAARSAPPLSTRVSSISKKINGHLQAASTELDPATIVPHKTRGCSRFSLLPTHSSVLINDRYDMLLRRGFDCPRGSPHSMGPIEYVTDPG